MNNIKYALHEDGFVVSRVDCEVAWPIRDYAAIGKGGVDNDTSTGEEGTAVYGVGNFNGPTRYSLERIGVRSVRDEWHNLVWTRKIPLAAKNYHRKFWGMKPLVGPEVQVPCEKCRARISITEAAALRVLQNRNVWSRLHHICKTCYTALTQKQR